MKALLLSIMVWLGVVTPPPVLVIDAFDPGGDVSTYLTFFDREAKSGISVILDGACVSACTLFVALFTPDKICVTERASLGVHQARDQNGDIDKEATRVLQTTFYPPWLKQWIRDYEAVNGELTIEVVYIDYTELSKHYRTCTASEAPIGANI